jgi:hypothetical protein
MPEQFANLIQRASLSQQARGQRVSKHMGAGVRRLYAGMFQSTHDERGNRRRGSKNQLTEPGVEEKPGDWSKAGGHVVNRRQGPRRHRRATAVVPISRPFREW